MGIHSQPKDQAGKKPIAAVGGSGLIVGEYEADGEQSEKCLEGQLKWIKSNESQTLMIGARGLLFGLGAEKPEKSQDGECQLEFWSKQEANVISGWQEEKCKKSPLRRYETEITPVKDGLIYKRRVLTDKKESESLTCRLKLVKNATH